MRWRWHVPRTISFCWRLLCALAFTLLQDCQPSEPDAQLQRYAHALAESLAVAPPTTTISTVPIPPPPDALQLAIPTSSLDALDILSLSGCAVQATMVKRNSNLGRAAKASQRLLLALEFLQLVPACIGHLREQGNEALAIRLETAWQEHRAQLPALIFNATLGSDEYRAFWLTGRAPLDYPHSTPGAATIALQSIDSDVRRWLEGDYRAQNREFELLLGEIAGGDGGALHRYLADLDSITGLEQQLAAVLPPPYRDWQQQRNQRFTAIATAAQQHATHFESLLQRCNIARLALSHIDGKIGYTAPPAPVQPDITED